MVRDGSFLGAVAEREEQAVKAADTLRAGAHWSEQETLPAMDQLHEWLLAQPVSSYRVVEGVPVEGAIDPIAAPAGAARTLDATCPAVPHARVDRPFGRARQWTDGELTVWSHSQGVHLLRGALAQALATEADRVRVVHVEGPGCYGHNGADDAALDAALLARASLDAQVRLRWTREDEHAWEPYGPAMLVKIRRASMNGAVCWTGTTTCAATPTWGAPLPTATARR